MADPTAFPTPRNRLLQALPPEDLAALWPRLQPVELELKQVVQLPEVPIDAVYFPETGWFSMIAKLKDGGGTEVGLVGYEGMVGLPLLLGAELDDLVEAMVQCQGTALRLPAADFRAALDQLPEFRRLLHRYALVHLGQVTCTAACNGRHDIFQRLARWLLMGHDRAEGDTYPMTHEFLSIMLGVRRSGVSTAAMVLQKAGLIRYRTGHLTITDRPSLENASCECYGVQRRASERLFGLDGNRTPYRH